MERLEDIFADMRAWSNAVYERHGDSATICAFMKRLRSYARQETSAQERLDKAEAKITTLKRREQELKKCLFEMAELADDLKCADINNFFDTVEVDKLIKKARRLAK